MGKKAKRIKELEAELEMLRETFTRERNRAKLVMDTQEELLQKAQAELKEWHYLGDVLLCWAGGLPDTDWTALAFMAEKAGRPIKVRVAPHDTNPHGAVRRPHQSVRFIREREEAYGERGVQHENLHQ